MRTRKYIFDIMALAAMLTLMMVSCRKEAPVLHDPNNIPCKTYTQQFQAVWEGVDQSYVFWERDTVNWDKRYDLCLPISRILMPVALPILSLPKSIRRLG